MKTVSPSFSQCFAMAPALRAARHCPPYARFFDDVPGSPPRIAQRGRRRPPARGSGWITAYVTPFLMERLREASKGKVSSAAVTASKREELKPPVASRTPSRPAASMPALPHSIASSSVAPSLMPADPVLARKFVSVGCPLIAGGLVILLLLVA